MEPRIHYARTRDGGSVAYTVSGNGPLLIWCQPYSHQQLDWRTEPMARFYRSLALSHTLVRYDGRGLGMSGLEGRAMSADLILADLEAVVEATTDGRFDLVAVSGLGFPAITYTARHPERVRRFVLWATPQKGVQFREGPRVRSMRAISEIDDGLAIELHARWLFGPGRADQHAVEYARAAVNTANSEAYIDVLWAIDPAPELAAVTVPTLVLQPTGESLISQDHARNLAQAIDGSEFVLVDGDYYPYLAADQRALINLINDFLGTPGPLNLNGQALSKRERQILELVASGSSNPEIADTLTLSPRTVDRHIQNLYRKLGVHNRVEAANWAREHGIRSID